MNSPLNLTIADAALVEACCAWCDLAQNPSYTWRKIYKLACLMDAADGRYHWQFRLDQVASRAMVQNGEAVDIWRQIRPATKRTRMLSIDDLFKGRHFDQEIIIHCVRWYLRFKLSFQDLVKMMAERGISLAHTAMMRWI